MCKSRQKSNLRSVRIIFSPKKKEKRINLILDDIQVNKRPKLPKFTTPQRESNRFCFWFCSCSNDIFILKNWFRLLGVPFWSNDSFVDRVNSNIFHYFHFCFLFDAFLAVVRIGLVGNGARVINELRQNDYFKCNNHWWLGMSFKALFICKTISFLFLFWIVFIEYNYQSVYIKRFWMKKSINFSLNCSF